MAKRQKLTRFAYELELDQSQHESLRVNASGWQTKRKSNALASTSESVWPGLYWASGWQNTEENWTQNAVHVTCCLDRPLISSVTPYRISFVVSPFFSSFFFTIDLYLIRIGIVTQSGEPEKVCFCERQRIPRILSICGHVQSPTFHVSNSIQIRKSYCLTNLHWEVRHLKAGYTTEPKSSPTSPLRYPVYQFRAIFLYFRMKPMISG